MFDPLIYPIHTEFSPTTTAEARTPVVFLYALSVDIGTHNKTYFHNKETPHYKLNCTEAGQLLTLDHFNGN